MPRGLLRPVLLICSLAVAAPGSAAEIQDHPAVSRYPGAVPTRRDDDGFRSYKLVVGVNEQGKTDEEFLVGLAVEGDVTRFSYENPPERSAHEISTNYREALEEAGFEILFACAAAECGPSYARSRWGRVTGMRYFTPEMRYLAARHDGGDARLFVAVLVSPRRHQVEIVEETEMERGLVTARAIAEGLDLDGRVVLDGVLFDHDAATLKPESGPALEVIAVYLREHPDLNVYIVGHTDGTGKLDYNMNLSRARAQAVVDALVQDHAIAAGRLDAHGVGPLSPERANAGEKGRARNRRVEMVGR